MSCHDRVGFCLLLVALLATATSTAARETTPKTVKENESNCELWMAPSQRYPGRLNLYAGVELREGQQVGQKEQLLSIVDTNANEWSQWHDVIWDMPPAGGEHLVAHNEFRTMHFHPGIGSLALCSEEAWNIQRVFHEGGPKIVADRNKHASAGAFGHDAVKFLATDTIARGSELFFDCLEDAEAIRVDQFVENQASLPWLQTVGACVDGIQVKKSTIPDIGRGAFAKRKVSQGDTITTSPAVIFNRWQMQIIEQYYSDVEKRVVFEETVRDEQLLLNYCLELPGTKSLLLPTGPGVSFINHNQTANVKVHWSSHYLFDAHEALKPSIEDAMDEGGAELMLDYVATRDIEPGEELFFDYGEDWETAWQAYQNTWESPEDDKVADKVFASDVEKELADTYFRTFKEQEEYPYPDGVYTSCFYKHHFNLNARNVRDARKPKKDPWWFETNNDCLRPCVIIERKFFGETSFYYVEMRPMVNLLLRESCSLPSNFTFVDWVPQRAIRLVDNEYTTDQHLDARFRYPMSLQKFNVPPHWQYEEKDPMGDFILPDLKPGQLSNVIWSDDGEIVTPNAYLIGLPTSVREVMLKYCDYMGITEQFKDLTVRGNSLTQDEFSTVNLQGQNWLIQRPAKKWMSNMHWISPSDQESQEDYLTALSASGFDETLDAIGKFFDMDGLAAYHVTFIGVSHSVRGFLHYDVTKTGVKVFNVIIPLILANATGPELDIRSSDAQDVGRLRYQYDIASMMGDDADHATSEVDYRLTREVRMAATVYVADINEDNIDAIMRDYTQHYPPRDRPDILLEMAGTHWNATDDSVKLPSPDSAWLSKVLGQN
eukprot:CAMPEP_0119571430 /NCGR_PEP_ID=MMETSP1352-20130426/44116_1 /TAXON_ID=265584 /ORGANISM="Stauroneis constricta, Strain CCMP1120" /LENGTH=829 /DNA_ID=CAMNT_0007621109 /DNA_START=132 /DNA_END=2621 /DNA_ORIENTATION=+